jgi:hypothetical protein
MQLFFLAKASLAATEPLANKSAKVSSMVSIFMTLPLIQIWKGADYQFLREQPATIGEIT